MTRYDRIIRGGLVVTEKDVAQADIAVADETIAAVVETFTVPTRSPPVPTMSSAPAGASTGVIAARMASAAPMISSIVSPRSLSPMRKAPSCAGVASPRKIRENAAFASSRARGAPETSAAM